MRPLRLALLLPLLALLGCDSGDDTEPAARVSGIEVRTEWNSWIGILGDPTWTAPPDGQVQSFVPYPNPGMSAAAAGGGAVLRITYSLRTPQTVRVRVDRLDATPAFRALVQAAAPTFSPGAPAAVRAFPEEQQVAGSYEVAWDGADDAGRPAGPGYYRLTLVAGGETYTTDAMLVSTEQELHGVVSASVRP